MTPSQSVHSQAGTLSLWLPGGAGRQARVPEQRLAHVGPRYVSPAASLEAEMGWAAPGHTAPGGSGGGRQSGG